MGIGAARAALLLRKRQQAVLKHLMPTVESKPLCSPKATAPVKGNNASGESGRIIVTYKGGIYDLTGFVKDHPGGEEIIRQFQNEDLSETFHDAAHHKHSKAAQNLLKQYRISDVKTSSSGHTNDMEGGMFLDLDKPLVRQMLELRITKEEYLTQVHIPRHLGRDARFFESDYLEVFTKTPWWIIPLFWLPISYFALLKGTAILGAKDSDFTKVYAAALWVLGLCSWTLLEYVFHRLVFHITKRLPNHRYAFTLHFLMHGVHHYLPMDRYRLVMPPIMFSFLSGNVVNLLRFIIPWGELLVLISGVFVGYVIYDLMHYHFHHARPVGSYIRKMKTYHMDHHYVDEMLGFGVSTKFWDGIFGTLLPIKDKC